MIRTGYLRWEIEVAEGRSDQDRSAREVRFLARPSYRVVRVRNDHPDQTAERFARGEVAYDHVLRAVDRPGTEVDITIPDIGPKVFRYADRDRERLPRFWMEKLQREITSFAFEVVHVAAGFPQLVIRNEALRSGYARMVEQETVRVMTGRSQPQPTRDDEPMRIEVQVYRQGVPELVAAELVRDVVEPKEFAEFRSLDRVTIKNGDRYYRIPRRAHGLIEVWNAKTLRGEAELCVVFQDPGMPPSDEVVMKYLLAKHQPDLLWQMAVRFGPPRGKFDGAPTTQW